MHGWCTETARRVKLQQWPAVDVAAIAAGIRQTSKDQHAYLNLAAPDVVQPMTRRPLKVLFTISASFLSYNPCMTASSFIHSVDSSCASSALASVHHLQRPCTALS